MSNQKVNSQKKQKIKQQNQNHETNKSDFRRIF